MDNSKDNVGTQADSLIANPSLRLHVAWRARRKGKAVISRRSNDPRDLQLMAWLLQHTSKGSGELPATAIDSLPPDLIALGCESGLLIRQDEVPGWPDHYRCELDPELLSLVPDKALHRLTSDRDAFSINPTVTFFDEASSDASANGRLETSRLPWQHLDGFTPPVHDRLNQRPPDLWITNPGSGIREPFWAGRLLTVERLQYICRTGDVASLNPEEFAILSLAHVITLPSQSAQSAPLADELKRPYLFLSGVLSPLQIAACRRHFRAIRENGFFRTDELQVRGMRDGLYCEAASMYFLSVFAPVLAKAVAAAVQPSNTWVFRYLPGAVLERHTDRSQCRWNVSLCIDVDNDSNAASWPIHFETDAGVVADH